MKQLIKLGEVRANWGCCTFGQCQTFEPYFLYELILVSKIPPRDLKQIRILVNGRMVYSSTGPLAVLRARLLGIKCPPRNLVIAVGGEDSPMLVIPKNQFGLEIGLGKYSGRAKATPDPYAEIFGLVKWRNR